MPNINLFIIFTALFACVVVPPWAMWRFFTTNHLER